MGAEVTGVRHVKVWVADLAVSRAWYTKVFDLEQFVEFEDSDGVVRGVGYRVRDAGFSLMLREDPSRARAMNDADPFALAARFEDLSAWGEHLDELGVWHTPVIAASSGHVLGFRDPDGIQIRLYAEDGDASTPPVFRAPTPTG